MPMTGLRGLCRYLSLGLLLFAAPLAVQADSIITVGTDDHTGAYYRGGGGICSLVNASRSEHRMRCRVTSTAGAADNIEALRRGRWELGFASNDIARDALQGSGAFSGDGDFTGLRVVTALDHETVTIVARAAAGVDGVRDLEGLRLNIGPAGSTQRAVLSGLMQVLGWAEGDFADTRSLTQTEQVDAFCNDELDAVMFVSSHPSRDVRDSLRCDGELVAIEGAAVNRMIRDRDTYSSAAIPGGIYDGVTEDVPTYSVVTLLLSATHTDQQTIYEVTRALYEGLADFRGWHAAFEELDTTSMVERTRASGIPLHPGAEAYFEDNDL